MKLNFIENEGLWKEFANYLNYNFNKLNITINRLDRVGSEWLSSYKGAYRTLPELNIAHPKPSLGDYALVLSAGVTFNVYAVDQRGTWVATGGTYRPKVELKDYIETVGLSNIDDLEEEIRDYLRYD